MIFFSSGSWLILKYDYIISINKKNIMRKLKEPQEEKKSILISKDVHTHLKLYAAKNGLMIKTVVEDILSNHVKENLK